MLGGGKIFNEVILIKIETGCARKNLETQLEEFKGIVLRNIDEIHEEILNEIVGTVRKTKI